MAKSFLNNPDLPKGLRNNNPGNLRRLPLKNGKPQYWEGEVPYSQSQDPAFSQFKELRYGLRALMRNMVNKINGGLDTVHSFINVYAPASDNNDTNGYINIVATALGIDKFAKIDLSEETVIAMSKIIVTMEIGSQAANMITHSDYLEAVAIIGLPLKKKAVTHS